MIIITHREALLALADVIYEVRDGKLHRVPNPDTTVLAKTSESVADPLQHRVA